MEASERRLGMGPETGRRLAVLGAAALITAVTFTLIFLVFTWLPYPMFRVWMRMSHEARVIVTAVFYFSLFSFVMGSTIRRQRLRKLRGRG
jgi:polyferredoxin